MLLIVKIGETTYKALVDTGTATSYVRTGVAAHCKREGWIEQPENKVAVVAVRNEIDIKESIQSISIILGGKINHRFFVLSTLPHDILLGADVLRKLDLRICVGNTPVWPSEPQDIPALRQECHLCSTENPSEREELRDSGAEPKSLRKLKPEEQSRLGEFLK